MYNLFQPKYRTFFNPKEYAMSSTPTFRGPNSSTTSTWNEIANMLFFSLAPLVGSVVSAMTFATTYLPFEVGAYQGVGLGIICTLIIKLSNRQRFFLSLSIGISLALVTVYVIPIAQLKMGPGALLVATLAFMAAFNFFHYIITLLQSLRDP